MAAIGFIGSGNMAEALIKGVIDGNVCQPANILISDIRPERRAELAERYKITAVESNAALAEAAAVVVLSVKPQNISTVLRDIKSAVQENALVISIAAGVPVGDISAWLENVEIVRVMPNTPALIGQGISAYFSKNASWESLKMTRRLLSAVGQCVEVEDEGLMDAVTAVSGSGPAYFFLLMEEMIRAGVQMGLSNVVARQLVLQTAKGAAMLASQGGADGETPGRLRKKVTSPGGTTEAALKVFDEQKFSEIVSTALTAARDRSRELSE